MPPLFDRLGGADAIEAAVDLFYAKVVADDRIRHFFDGIPMERLKAHQRAFLTTAFGGPSIYHGRSMQDAHAALVDDGLEDAHFDAVMEHLGGTLTDLGVADDLVAEAAAAADSVRDAVLGRAG